MSCWQIVKTKHSTFVLGQIQKNYPGIIYSIDIFNILEPALFPGELCWNSKAGVRNICFHILADGTRRGDWAAEEPTEGEGRAGSSSCTSWLRSPQPADGTAEQTGGTESGNDQCSWSMKMCFVWFCDFMCYVMLADLFKVSFVDRSGSSRHCLRLSVCDVCLEGPRARQVLSAKGSGVKDSDAGVTAVRLRLCEESAETAAPGTTGTARAQPQCSNKWAQQQGLTTHHLLLSDQNRQTQNITFKYLCVFPLRCWGCSRLWRNPSWMRNSLNTNSRCRQRPWITRWRSCELWTSTPRAPWHLRWWRCRWKSWSWRTSRSASATLSTSSDLGVSFRELLSSSVIQLYQINVFVS